MKTLKRAVLAVILLACASVAQAQTTNVVQNLSIQLFGFSQGGTSSFGSIVTTNVNFARVDNRAIIQALGIATFNSFSTTSKLVVVTPVDGGPSSIQVRDGANNPVDVTDFFQIQALSGSVNGSVLNTRTGRGTGISYDIEQFALQDADGQTLVLHFNVNGIATSNSTTPMSGPQTTTINANVAGSGDSNGNLLILQGSINVFGRTIEVVQGGGVS